MAAKQDILHRMMDRVSDLLDPPVPAAKGATVATQPKQVFDQESAEHMRIAGETQTPEQPAEQPAQEPDQAPEEVTPFTEPGQEPGRAPEPPQEQPQPSSAPPQQHSVQTGPYAVSDPHRKA